MKNKEFFQKELVEIALSGCGVALMCGAPTKCGAGINCLECGFSIEGYTCIQALQEWAEAEYIEPENNPFDIKEGDKYYCVDEKGHVKRFISYDSSNSVDVIKFGNACKDQAYMKRRTQEIKLYNLLSNFAHEVNQDWKPDWNNKNELKWYVCINHCRTSTQICCNDTNESLNTVYFKTQALAEQAANEIVLPFIREEQEK